MSTTLDDLTGHVERAMARMATHEIVREHAEATGHTFTYHEDTHTWTDDDDTELDPGDIPDDHPVRPLDDMADAVTPTTCGVCGLSWDDGVSTSMTPAPAARCPFEYFHGDAASHLDADDMTEILGDAPSSLWIMDALDMRVHGSRSLYGDDFTWSHVSVLLTLGGPNVWADWDGSRWHIHGHWGSDEVHRYMPDTDAGIGEHLTEIAEAAGH